MNATLIYKGKESNLEEIYGFSNILDSLDNMTKIMDLTTDDPIYIRLNLDGVTHSLMPLSESFQFVNSLAKSEQY